MRESYGRYAGCIVITCQSARLGKCENKLVLKVSIIHTWEIKLLTNLSWFVVCTRFSNSSLRYLLIDGQGYIFGSRVYSVDGAAAMQSIRAKTVIIYSRLLTRMN